MVNEEPALASPHPACLKIRPPPSITLLANTWAHSCVPPPQTFNSCVPPLKKTKSPTKKITKQESPAHENMDNRSPLVQAVAREIALEAITSPFPQPYPWSLLLSATSLAGARSISGEEPQEFG